MTDCTPVLPCLHAIAIEEEVERLPVVVDLITIMHYIVGCRDQAGDGQKQEGDPC